MAEIVDEPGFRNRTRLFDDRLHAGELLSIKLREYEGRRDAILLAIPAGGVQVAFIVAKKLEIPLDLAITRKIHVPWNREAGFGAISWDGLIFLNKSLVASLRLTKEAIDRCVAEEKGVIRRRLKMFRGDRPFPELKDKTAIVLDDGLASGFSMLTTLKAIHRRGVKEVVVAVPTAPSSAIELIKPHADRVFCLNVRSSPFFAVADAYKLWFDLEDEDVASVLELARREGLCL